MIYFSLICIILQYSIIYSEVLVNYQPYGIKRFTNTTNFTRIFLLDKYVYVGAKDYLYKFDASNIENLKSPYYNYLYLPANYEQKEQCMLTYYDENLCNNFIKTILNRPNSNDLYVCGSYAFTPHLFQISYDLTLIKEDDGYGYCSLNPLDSSTSIWIEQGNPLNIPSLYSGSLLDASTKTQPVEPVIYRAELKQGDKSYPYLRTPKFDSDWLYQPVFIASFDVDDYVLFFLREKSTEQIAENQDVYYSRVIRVCKNDAGTVNLGNQWTSMRKIRLTCSYNNTYLNHLDDVIRVSDETFVGVFSIKLPTHSVSYLCEFKKSSIITALNTNSFKEVIPGTQYWSKLSTDKIPKSLPTNCDFNSQLLKDDVSNFIKSHSLIGDSIETQLLYYIDKQVTKITVDTIKTIDNNRINVYYLATNDGTIIKVADLANDGSFKRISQWKVCDEAIDEIKVKAGTSVYVSTSLGFYQIPLIQCDRYYLCSTCMTDPYCGWNMRKNQCEYQSVNSNLISLNQNICSRFQNKNDNVKIVQADTDTNVYLDCNINDNYLLDYVEWKRDNMLINFNKNSNMVITLNKDLLILNGNTTQNGIYNCVINNEIIASYSISFKQNSSKTQLTSGNSPNQKCITAESYIRQYNNWCDEFSRYQRALNEWEDLKDKTCGKN